MASFPSYTENTPQSPSSSDSLDPGFTPKWPEPHAWPWLLSHRVAHDHALDDPSLSRVGLQVPDVTLGAGLHDGRLPIPWSSGFGFGFAAGHGHFYGQRRGTVEAPPCFLVSFSLFFLGGGSEIVAPPATPRAIR